MRLSPSLLMALVLLSLLAGTVSATSQQESPTTAALSQSAVATVQPAVTVLPATLSVSRIAHGKAEVRILIANGGSDAQVSFVPLLTDTNGNTVDARVDWIEDGTPPKSVLRSGDVRQVTLAIYPAKRPFNSWWDERLPWRGYVAVYARGEGATGPGTSTAHDIAIPQIQPSGLEVLVLFVCLLVALAVTGFSLLLCTADAPSGPAALTADSLASNVGIGAGLLNGLLALTSLPSLTAFATRETYALLAVVFAALIALGAPVSNLLGRIASGSADHLPKVGFAAAAFLVLWGALGQMVLGVLLVRELHDAGALAWSSQWLLFVLIATMTLGVGLYVGNVVASPQGRTNTSGAAFATMRTSSNAGWSVP